VGGGSTQCQTSVARESPSYQVQCRSEQTGQKWRGLRNEAWPKGRTGQIDHFSDTRRGQGPPTVETPSSVEDDRSGPSEHRQEEEKKVESHLSKRRHSMNGSTRSGIFGIEYKEGEER